MADDSSHPSKRRPPNDLGNDEQKPKRRVVRPRPEASVGYRQEQNASLSKSYHPRSKKRKSPCARQQKMRTSPSARRSKNWRQKGKSSVRYFRNSSANVRISTSNEVTSLAANARAPITIDTGVLSVPAAFARVMTIWLIGAHAMKRRGGRPLPQNGPSHMCPLRSHIGAFPLLPGSKLSNRKTRNA
jgi:hypothetical protein